MKFNPTLPSVIVAFNKPTKEQDIALIRRFYSGPIIETIGYWEGVEERSYQLEERPVCKTRLLMALNSTNQDGYISIRGRGLVVMNTFNGFKFIGEYVGKMTQIEELSDCCTYCPLTQTYWKAIK